MTFSLLSVARADEGSTEPEEQAPQPAEPAPPASDAASDHTGHVHHVGLGFMGARFVPAATLGAGKTVVITNTGDAVLSIGTDEVTVPVFGVRYWFHERVGLDVGLGFNVASGSMVREVPNPDPTLSRTDEADAPSTKAFVGHLALPISVYSASHFGVLLLPELDIGYSGATYPTFEVSTTGEELDLALSGLLVGAGARLGAEMTFGFIDLPQVTLQLSWGLRVEYRKHTGSIGDAEQVLSETEFGTSWYDDPWQLLAGNIAATYYF